MAEHVHGYRPTEENTTIYEVDNANATFDLAKTYASIAKPGQIYLLSGDLGVGKSVFVRGFALGAGINDNITSPTYTIVDEYDATNFKLYHFDLYRITDMSELDEIGFDEYLDSNCITLIEWPDIVSDYIINNYDNVIIVKIDKDLSRGEDYRIIRIVNKNKSSE